MSVTIASGSVLLNRVLTLREDVSLMLSLDTVLQSSAYLTSEVVYKLKKHTGDISKVIYVSFETTNKPEFADIYIEALNKPIDKILEEIQSIKAVPKALIVIDSFNYIDTTGALVKFLKRIVCASNIVYGTYHLDIPSSTSLANRSSRLALLKFMAGAIFEVRPTLKGYDQTQLTNAIRYLDIPINQCNGKNFEITLVFRRKSGRSMNYNIKINTVTHTYTSIDETGKEKKNKERENEEKLLAGLTTFNLGTTKKQKEEREKVELPFMEAQKSMGSIAGSTVYEFDKDDDYDEDDDPYEEPM